VGKLPDVTKVPGIFAETFFRVTKRVAVRLTGGQRGIGMTNYSKNAETDSLFRNLFKTREIFLHDGTSLKRVRVAGGAQAGITAGFLAMLAWAVFATVQLVSAPMPAGPELARMQRDVMAMQADVDAMKQVAAQRYQLTALELKKLGLNPDRFHGRGGPLEEIDQAPADANFRALFTSWKQLEQLEQGSIAVPSAAPVRGTAFTSGFGVRSDPFRGSRAMHAGIDLAGPLGTPIYATADGIVGRSQWVNGYGNLVELNHGRGIQTRYGHLSRSMVSAGKKVKRGDLIALMGSTGRSTGSHLHYEVRIDGRAVNPVPFMQSTDYLRTVQNRAAAIPAVALGGPDDASK
jgi:murein DD-endopeptidase MepM/ murein hydrolase activator NlpD